MRAPIGVVAALPAEARCLSGGDEPACPRSLTGEPGALDSYQAAIAARFDDYLRIRNYFYEHLRLPLAFIRAPGFG
ncbi:MAG: hypothetical protein ACT4QB_12980 [Gammaproteobacteria bacterium]